jgi:hypothetical protein
MSPDPAAAWTRALEQIEALMRRSLALAAQPEASVPATDLEEPLRRLDERLAGWEERLARARQDASEADTLLEDATTETRAWVEQMARARANLVSRAA